MELNLVAFLYQYQSKTSSTTFCMFSLKIKIFRQAICLHLICTVMVRVAFTLTWCMKMSEYFNLPGFNNDLLDTDHSVHWMQPVHSVHSVHSVQPVHSYKPVKPVHFVHSAQPVLLITGSNSWRLWHRLYFIHQGTHTPALMKIKDTQKHNKLRKRVQKVA